MAQATHYLSTYGSRYGESKPVKVSFGGDDLNLEPDCSVDRTFGPTARNPLKVVVRGIPTHPKYVNEVLDAVICVLEALAVSILKYLQTSTGYEAACLNVNNHASDNHGEEVDEGFTKARCSNCSSTSSNGAV
ncbi:5588_t:CDS:2 [Paraglomus brasilianum]|uniref:5588_t:CDS:1 n=1 Tax=Paraglomus brasilianum TaxID=144538 RepID=A0A9N9F958_9GLOM|nr:5588_t:CDS:2 [Paraglomus brasilianum]